VESTIRYIVVMDNGMGQIIRFCESKDSVRKILRENKMDSPFADSQVFEVPMNKLSYDDLWKGIV
jgi:hypothetical protein